MSGRATDDERALAEAYLSCQGNLFWQFFMGEIRRREEYCRQRLAQAASWEEVCRLQGALASCRQLAELAQNQGKEKEDGF